MGGIGIVNNPRSRRNRRHPGVARRLAASLRGDGELLDASTPDELARAVERFRAARIDVLGVNGGDGTGHVVLTAFARAWRGAPLPALLLLRGGAMNTVAHGHGIHGRPERILRDVLARRRAGLPLRTVPRHLLGVREDGGDPRYGFIFGTGAIVRFLEAYYAHGRTSPAAAALLVARGFASALAGGRFAAALAARERLEVATDGGEWPAASYLALAAGTTPDIGFGFRAFRRCDEAPDRFHLVGVTASPTRLALALPRLRAGRPWRRAVAHDALAREARVGGARRYTLDGDLYGAGGELRLELGPAVDIVLP